MKSLSVHLRVLLAVSLSLPSSCATSRPAESDEQVLPPDTHAVRVTKLAEEQLQLDFTPVPLSPAWEMLREDEVREVLDGFLRCQDAPTRLSVIPALASSTQRLAPWEPPLRAEFLGRYGPALLPLPASLERSPLFMALRLSYRYMGAGIRDAARELFRSPLFLASLTLSVLVYFAAWLYPEPIFSKSFAAALTARLALAVGLLELRNVALAVLRLYREAQAARTLAEVEAVAERFGRALGGTALRVFIMVASLGVAKVLPNVPPGGMGPLLSPPRFAVAGGLSLQGATTAQVVADGTIVLAGAAVGAAGAAVGRACADGTQKREGFQWHHLATNKNDISETNGGPWTPLFEDIFAMAGMDLDAPENQVYLQGHKGPHSREYHNKIYQALRGAVTNCKTTAACKKSLVQALNQLAEKVCTPGSQLYRLATKTGS